MTKYLTLTLAFVAPIIVGAVELDGIAARVGSDVILKSEVIEELRRLNYDESHYDEVRNRLIERSLILKAAGEAKVTMQEWVVENRIREIIDHGFDGDRNKLIDMLASQQMSYPEWRKRMRDDMMVAAMRWQTIDKNVTASPAAMRKEYTEHAERYSAEHKVTVSVILLGPKDVAKKEEVESALKEKDFAEVARAYSADVHAAEGGQWKDVKPEEVFRPEICAELDKMPKGTISNWVELDGWCFLLRKDAESAGEALSFEVAYDKIEANVKEATAKRLYQDWVELLKSETYIKVY